MCLCVKKETNKTIQKCLKVLYKNNQQYFHDYGKDRFYTPYRDFFVPTNGWLIPDYRGKITTTLSVYSENKGRLYNDVEGGFIHAYVTKEDSHRDYYYKEAYAIKVCAYGTNSDLVCRALYIPIADRNTKRRKEIVKFLESKPTTKEIIEKFPFLKDKI